MIVRECDYRICGKGGKKPQMPLAISLLFAIDTVLKTARQVGFVCFLFFLSH